MENLTPTPKEMIEAISRSGYLLESQVTEWLLKAGFFVQPNQAIEDRISGKSREIDLLAERFPDLDKKEENKVTVIVKHAFEIKNNSMPMVLTTNSPHLDTTAALREFITPRLESSISPDLTFYDLLVYNKDTPIFSQYCSFKRKKDAASNSELMAWHPDDFHDGLIKIVQYCDDEVAEWTNRNEDRFHRDLLYLPTLILGGDLFELSILSGRPKMKKVKISKLMYNYHYKNENKSAIIFVVTKDGFPSFITEINNIEDLVKRNILQALKGNKS